MPGAAAAAAAILALTATGCGTTTGGGGGEGGANASVEEGFQVGLLLPESKTTRYEKFDRPYFEEAIAELCPNCTVAYQNADQDTAKQQSQAEAMLTEGVDVLVLDAVDAEAAASIVQQARSQNVPVVAYDRLAQGGVDYYVSFDNRTIGTVQGQALIEALEAEGAGEDPEIVMINGSPTDPNAADYKAGAHEVLDGQVSIGMEYDTPDWSPDRAQQQMEQAITSIGADEIDGVYSANDGMASGVIAALKSAGVEELPPVTGQDAELAAIQRIIAGDQFMTIYKAIQPEARTAAEMAIAAATGEEYDGGEFGLVEVEDAGGETVPAVLLEPVVVTEDNIEDTVVSDGFYTIEEICTDAYADTDFCTQAAS
ncbi:ABC transporter substrate-binding protein [Marinitenerispora sediminis]|uniref:ABC transporter substrate-binding protein n=1 Tax=Marinitenerispora sediminis TaxID=1931232 RepID=A0A368T9L2_9ACTN|nr:sugar ABC transporter substrate-binding protein [Marinitenerispora sediminis]RCV52381.1 ABC transporter substrate-binding protein [Marinitenerispora sediminis]RCV60943.1 ABC transporter substrate-binding protein [Marinitenerispora sediminis]RCV62236.1 ABC transporter substrate-binding protein [Marinitenerispora sediminis]